MRLVSLYKTLQARTALRDEFSHQPRQNKLSRTFGMGVLAPGLVAAFQACGEAAVRNGKWDGSGKRRHSLGSLTNSIQEIYASIWVPAARAAYDSARSHFALQLMVGRNGDTQRLKILEMRREIADVQMETFEQDLRTSPEAARNVWMSTSAEAWT